MRRRDVPFKEDGIIRLPQSHLAVIAVSNQPPETALLALIERTLGVERILKRFIQYVMCARSFNGKRSKLRLLHLDLLTASLLVYLSFLCGLEGDTSEAARLIIRFYGEGRASR